MVRLARKRSHCPGARPPRPARGVPTLPPARHSAGRLAAGLLVAGLLTAVPAARADVISDNLSAYTGVNARGYLNPLKESFGQVLNTGLYNSAAIPRDKMYFRLEVKAFQVSYKDEDRTFKARTEDYFPGGQSVDAPTVIGSTDGVQVVDATTGARYNMPGGLDLDKLTIGVPQVTLGSLQGLELTARAFVHKFGDTDLGDIKLYGGALRYGVNAAFPNLPVDVAVLFGYQKFKLGDDFVDSNAITYGAQVGRSAGVLDIYGGIGVDRYKLDVSYDAAVGSTAPRTTVELPAESDLHLTAGATLHLSVLHLNAEYDHAAQSSFAVGLGIGNR